VYTRALVDGREPREEGQLFAWQATAHWMRGEKDACRDLAARAFELATSAGDHQALAAAHTALALVAAMEGDLRGDLDNYLKALHHAEQAGDLLQIIRVRANLGSRLGREAKYREAIAELDEVVRLADLAGFADYRAVGLANRGEARHQLGQLEEAIVDCTAAAEGWRQMGSMRESLALADLGNIYRERGDLTMARGFYEHAVALTERFGEVQGLVVALAGLARTLAREDPDEAERLATRAMSIGPGIRRVEALLAAGWVALSRGDRTQASAVAAEAAATARDRRDRAALAEAVELGVLSSPDPAAEAGRLEEAVAIWREIGNPLGEARSTVVAGFLLDTPGARALARRAEQRLRVLGVHAQAERAAGPLASVVGDHGTQLKIRTLGPFEVVRDGEPVGPSAWQSRKARDLLKILVATHGRPVTREALMDVLWPEDEPDKLSNRLSVALATVRSVLDPERRLPSHHFVVADAVAVRLNLGHLQVDVERFLADAAAGLRLLREGHIEEGTDLLVEADAAYAGDFLEEDVYEDWAISRREEARAAYVGVARTLAHEAIRGGDHDGAVRYYLRLLERDPFDEDAHLGLVATLDGAGRHGEARRRYRAYVSRMEEIEVEAAPFPGGGPGLTAKRS
jgi:DNA-binding SARP family transcriptional activator